MLTVWSDRFLFVCQVHLWRLVMSKRFKMTKRQSRRDFSKNGSVTHKRNMMRPGAGRNPMRGGIRL